MRCRSEDGQAARGRAVGLPGRRVRRAPGPRRCCACARRPDARRARRAGRARCCRTSWRTRAACGCARAPCSAVLAAAPARHAPEAPRLPPTVRQYVWQQVISRIKPTGTVTMSFSCLFFLILLLHLLCLVMSRAARVAEPAARRAGGGARQRHGRDQHRRRAAGRRCAGRPRGALQRLHLLHAAQRPGAGAAPARRAPAPARPARLAARAAGRR